MFNAINYKYYAATYMTVEMKITFKINSANKRYLQG